MFSFYLRKNLFRTVNKYVLYQTKRYMITPTSTIIGFNIDSQCPYQVLGITKDASIEDIKNAYKRVRLYNGYNPKIVYAYKFTMSHHNTEIDILDSEIISKNDPIADIIKPTEYKKWKYENVLTVALIGVFIITYHTIDINSNKKSKE